MTTTFTSASVSQTCRATWPETQYTLTKKYDAYNFLGSNGFAQYLSKEQALQAGLVRTDGGVIYIGVDNKTVLDPRTSLGRPSVRVESHDEFSSGLLIADIEHLPGNACGLWPAFWLLFDLRSDYSEIDIIEGVSLDTADEITLYTDNECYVDLRTDMIGTEENNYCRGPNHDQGVTADLTLFEGRDVTRKSCGVKAPKGGVWALLLDENNIKVWFFGRCRIPEDISKDKPDPSGWGTPIMKLGRGTCNIVEAWKKMKIVINITFCGHWPEGVWEVSGCAAKTKTECREYVAQNPKDFVEGYFLINWIKTFQ
ncbi:concanavalin A-like lectin/glucanase domain-containing protein [Lophiotrema nucula]|uniref:Concanavalin A-like lectin/glucanase domain-containing protein n=1 Tax=Lophiotrema nucula TaxID=690887 RepID=A0A6A5ZV35_9PLEO|nr:concanavalin A-like lectin/glucanase domain-containing protein [Lophiotrema nucula]